MDKIKIKKNLQKILKDNHVKFSKKNFENLNIFKHLSIDSFQLLSIISDIEKSFKIKFTDKLIHDLNKKNIQDIIDLIIKNKK